MAAAALPQDALLPRPPGGLGPGAALALLAHAGLLLALTHATDWRVQPPEVVSAELWAGVPQVAAPRPEPALAPAPTPAPTPAPEPAPPSPPPVPVKAEPPPRPDADIATERAEKRKADAEQKRRADDAQKARDLKAQAQRQADAARQQLAEAERAAKVEQKRRDAARETARDAARELLADEARLAEQREANLRRMMGQASPAGTGNPGSRGTAVQDAAPSAAYSGRLVALIRANTVFSGNLPDTAVAEVEVRAAASGIVLSRRLVKSSGQADWDEAVLRAIDRTGRLPRDTDGRVPPIIIIAFKPRE